MAKQAFKARKIFGEHGVEKSRLLVVEDGKFAGFCEPREALEQQIPILDYGGGMILPGLVDTHIHGAAGADTMDAIPAALERIGRYLLTEGTTSWQPTTVTSEIDLLCKAIANVEACKDMKHVARIIGCFVEGPYIAKEYKGAHPEHLLRPVDRGQVERMMAAGTVSVLAVAPELDDACPFIRWVTEQGVKVSLAHSAATYEEACAGIESGADAFVHTYSGMSGLHHRSPNMVGAALTRDDVYAELIADGNHASAPAMQILLRCKPYEKVLLVSDAIQDMGLPDGEYMLGVMPVTVKNGISRIENGALAGGTATLLQQVRRLVLELDVAPLQAVHMASLYPSRRMGIDSQYGSIKEGKVADFIVIDREFNLKETWLGGECLVKK